MVKEKPLPCPSGKRRPQPKAGDLSYEDKLWLGRAQVHFDKTPLYLHKLYGLKTNTLHKYASMVRQGSLLRDSGGRPAALDSPAKRAVVARCSVKGLKVREDDIDSILQEMAAETAEKNNRVPKKMSQATAKSYRTLLNLVPKKAETSTDARNAAVKDLTNYITFAAMNHAMVEELQVDPALILNIDATQYEVVHGAIAHRRA
jgi:hypothetical protein